MHVTTLAGDYFRYHEDTYELVGEATGMRYKLGQRIKVVVTGADRLMRTIDFRVASGQ